jgi:CarboxypepD_reg-like domain
MNKLKITIQQPCSENWNNMKPYGYGRYCDSCEKEVIDFTKFTDQDLINWFRKDSVNICGMLKPSQLNNLIVAKSTFSLKRFKPSLIAASLITLLSLPKISVANIKSHYPTFFSDQKSKSNVNLDIEDINESIVIKGKVLDKGDKSPIIGLSITQKGGKVLGTTDAKGDFEIKLGKDKFSKKAILEFRYLGYETKEYKVNLNKNVPMLIEMQISQAILGGLGFVIEKNTLDKIKDFFYS